MAQITPEFHEVTGTRQLTISQVNQMCLSKIIHGWWLRFTKLQQNMKEKSPTQRLHRGSICVFLSIRSWQCFQCRRLSCWNGWLVVWRMCYVKEKYYIYTYILYIYLLRIPLLIHHLNEMSHGCLFFLAGSTPCEVYSDKMYRLHSYYPTFSAGSLKQGVIPLMMG